MSALKATPEKTTQEPIEKTSPIISQLNILQEQLKNNPGNKEGIRNQILSLKRELNRTKQYTTIANSRLAEGKNSIDTISASDLMKLDKESGLRRGELLSKSFLYKRTKDTDGNIYEEPSDGKDLKEEDSLYVDFGKNGSAESKIGAGDFLSIDIKVIKITDTNGKARIGKRSIQGNKVGYYDENGYIPVYNGYKIDIPKKNEVEEIIKNSNPSILISSNEDDESKSKDAFIDTVIRYEKFGEGFSPFNILEKKEFQAKATELSKKIEEKYGIPWQVTYAQATLETGYGRRAPGNNYFGIKGNTGGTYTTKEVINGKEVEVSASFRGYESMEESFEDYAKLLTSNPRYSGAFKFKDNPEMFLQEIKNAGYATDPEYLAKAKGIWNSYDKIKNFNIETPEIIGKTNPDKFIEQAGRYIGTKYVWGGNSDVGIDCSHLISKSLSELGVTTPRFYRVAADLRNMIPSKPINQTIRGDLIFWHGTERGVSHVAIATGSPVNNTITVLDASGPSSGLGKVAERTITLNNNLSVGSPPFYS